MTEGPLDGVAEIESGSVPGRTIVGEAGVILRLDQVGELNPVPLKLTVCGDPVTLSKTDKIPVRVPEVVGEKVTRTEQLVLCAKVAQLLVCEKSPVTAIPLKAITGVPVLVTVTVWLGVLAPTAVPGKVRVAGAT